MNNAVKKIPSVPERSDDPVKLIDDLAALKSGIRDTAESALRDMQKAAELDPGSFETEALMKQGVSNLDDIELLDVFAAIEYDRLDYALKTLSQVLKENPTNIQAGELFQSVRNNHCWFCRKKGIPNRPDPSAAITVLMHKVAERDQSRIKWKKTEIRVPRCSACESVHGHDYRIGAGAGLIAGLLVNLAAGLYAGNFSILYFLAVNLVTTAAGTLFHSIWSGISRRSARPLKYGEQFPPLLKRELEGWSRGGNPPEINGYPVSGGGGS